MQRANPEAPAFAGTALRLLLLLLLLTTPDEAIQHRHRAKPIADLSSKQSRTAKRHGAPNRDYHDPLTKPAPAPPKWTQRKIRD